MKGLNDVEVIASREKYGSNILSDHIENGFIVALKSLLKEPMILLLLTASVIYYLAGNKGDALFMASAIIFVAAISLFQDRRSRGALRQLKDLTAPECKVIRSGKTNSLKIRELVVGDYIIVEEGGSVPADGIIIHSNDFSVNESMLTGESLPIFKSETQKDNLVFMGTIVTGGLAIATVNAVGNATRLGKIGKSLEDIDEQRSPLEVQINDFVKKMVIAGALVFIMVWAINYAHTYSVLGSMLKALTLAMSILPEEIPVAFTIFMALGAWRLMKIGIVVKEMKTVEALGGATIICTDKTGTITENKMELAKLYVPGAPDVSDVSNHLSNYELELIRYGMWASEPIPFDPMEIALHDAYKKTRLSDERPLFKMIHEYPLDGRPPMMTHIFENKEGKRIIAAKGGPEAIMRLSGLTEIEISQVQQMVNRLSEDGFRVLAVGEAVFEGTIFPDKQQQFRFRLMGLLAFYDPPKQNIQRVFEQFYAAGIDVKIVTGDYAATTVAIARQVGFKGCGPILSGDDILSLNDQALPVKAENCHIFARMFPEAKLKLVNALKAKNEVVAMMGDGVNDAPALKAANIGIAMGKKGTEVARRAAALVLLDDDFSKMPEAIAMGRKIYANLKKAIQYIISIHIPIILIVFVPLALGWKYPNIFSPVHIIFLELIMGPTCSIVYENEPMEKNTMLQKPRSFTNSFFNWRELLTSITQGLVITTAALLVYQFAVSSNFSQSVVRTMVFCVIIGANITLTLVNRSFYYSIFTTLRYKNNLLGFVILATTTITAMLIYVKPVASFLGFEALSFRDLAFALLAALLSVIWYELIKLRKRRMVIHKRSF